MSACRGRVPTNSDRPAIRPASAVQSQESKAQQHAPVCCGHPASSARVPELEEVPEAPASFPWQRPLTSAPLPPTEYVRKSNSVNVLCTSVCTCASAPPTLLGASTQPSTKSKPDCRLKRSLLSIFAAVLAVCRCQNLSSAYDGKSTTLGLVLRVAFTRGTVSILLRCFTATCCCWRAAA